MASHDDIEAAALPVIDRYGCDLVQLTFRRERSGWVLRLLIERKQADSGSGSGSGVDHQLCAAISRDLGAVLDVEDLIEQAYTMEVSSPGVERPLTRLADFERFAGRTAQLRTRVPLDGRRRFKGVLQGVRSDDVVLATADGTTFTIPSVQIEQANLVFEMKTLETKPGAR
jgi:ribosome maturation factor RimP